MRETIWDQFEHAAEWEPHFRVGFARLQLVDGTATRSMLLMRREAPDGSWQYRRTTVTAFLRAMAAARRARRGMNK